MSCGTASSAASPVANCSSFMVRSVWTMLAATWSTWPVTKSGSWRLTASSLREWILFSRRSISSLDQLAVVAGLLEVRQPCSGRLEVVLEGLADLLLLRRRPPRPAVCRVCLEGLDVRLICASSVVGEETLEHVLGVEQPQEDPEEPVEPGHLELLERRGRTRHRRPLIAAAICRSSRHRSRSLSKRRPDSGGKAARIRRRRSPRRRPSPPGGPPWLPGIDVLLELRVRPEEAEVGDLAGQDQRDEDVGLAGQERRSPSRRANASRFQWLRNAFLRYLPKFTGHLVAVGSRPRPPALLQLADQVADVVHRLLEPRLALHLLRRAGRTARSSAPAGSCPASCS